MIPDHSGPHPGRSGMIRVGTGMVRCHPCWHRVGTAVVRDGPWRLRAGSGMICTAAGAMPGRSGAVRSRYRVGSGETVGCCDFLNKTSRTIPGSPQTMVRDGPEWSVLVRAGPALYGTGAFDVSGQVGLN